MVQFYQKVDDMGDISRTFADVIKDIVFSLAQLRLHSKTVYKNWKIMATFFEV